MFVVLVAFAIAAGIIGMTFKVKKTSETVECQNVELIKYFETFQSSTINKKAALLRAAKYLIEFSSEIEKRERVVGALYKNGLVSDEYYSKITNIIENEIFFEKCLIQKEAETIKPGYGDVVFSEAASLPSIYKPVTHKFVPKLSMLYKKWNLRDLK